MAAIESDLSDIQFLGNWSSQQRSSTSFVSAIVLTPVGIETSPSDNTQTFSRHQTSVVHVGRAMFADPPVYLDDSATFSNPVMSRNHAKITFADSGSVFIIDTKSHHGTCVTRSTAEFNLAAEIPFQLQDGDKITFGKVVHRNDVHHKPLSVSVKLLYSVSTPSSMSISSRSVSPPSKATSPKARNRFGLDSSSDSDSASSIEDAHDMDPCTGPNAIRVDLPIRRLEGRISVSGSPKSPKVIDLIQSEPGTPTNTKPSINTPQTSPPVPLLSSPTRGLSGFQVDLVPAPGFEFDGMGIPPEVVHEGSPRANAPQSPTPPWRRLAGHPWSSVNTSIFDRIPDLLPQPPRRLGRLLNPLWPRASMVTDGDERGEIATSSRMLQSSGDIIGGMHESHAHQGHGLSHNQHTYDHLHGPQHHGHGGRGFRLDADWAYYGQSGDIKKEVVALSGRLTELQKDLDALKIKEASGDDLSLVFDRLDELSSQLKNKIDEDAKVSQQALFAESAGINALKDSIATLQNDVSALEISLQSDTRSLRADHAVLKTDWQQSSENRATEMKVMANDVHRFCRDARELRDDFETLKDKTLGMQQELTTLDGNLSGVHDTIEALQNYMQSTDVSIAEMRRDILASTAGHTAAEQDLSERIKEQVRSEVIALIEKEGELSSSLGKRKRGDEESMIFSVNKATPATPTSRPRKRLRVVVDCAAAGALGAFGAWLGLAFL